MVLCFLFLFFFKEHTPEEEEEQPRAEGAWPSYVTSYVTLS